MAISQMRQCMYSKKMQNDGTKIQRKQQQQQIHNTAEKGRRDVRDNESKIGLESKKTNSKIVLNSIREATNTHLEVFDISGEMKIVKGRKVAEMC